MTIVPCPRCGASLSDSASACATCDWRADTLPDDSSLRPGTDIQPPYRVLEVLGRGGFGVTYLGRDEHLALRVAIKEYFPAQWCRRDSKTGDVHARSPSEAALFERGLSAFLDEARTLARFQQHPGIVSVLSFFRAFGTGYMVMEYVEGETLKSLVRRQGPMNWKSTLDIFMHVMDSLRAVHQAGLLHRDVAPDNIYWCRDGRIKLLDFGSAGSAPVGDGIAQLKPGFAAIEQYQVGGVEGPWSDVYSVAASMVYCLTGRIPVNVQQRHQHTTTQATGADTWHLPARVLAQLPPSAEAVLRRALAVSPSQRPQTIVELQTALSGSVPPDVRPVNGNVPPSMDADRASGARQVGPIIVSRRWMIGLAVVLVIVVVLASLRNGAQPTRAPLTGRPATIEPELPAQAPQAEDIGVDWNEQRQREKQAAESLRRMQAEALARFEERERQEAQAARSDAARRNNENLRQLCDEWGATMDCAKPRR